MLPRMYTDLAGWWPLLSAPEEYAEEAAEYEQVLRAHARRPVEEVLELGSGGGNNASYMKRSFTMTLVDLSEDMLAVSRDLNPECEHLLGDMRTVRLGRTFDAVFIHDAILYMTTEDDLRAAIATAAEHLRSRGVALFVPDDTEESFRPRTSSGGHDGEGGRAMRYLEWSRKGPGTTEVSVFVYAYTEDGTTTRVEHEEHISGLFPRATWLRAIASAGLEPAELRNEHWSGEDDVEHTYFIGVAP